MAPIPAGLLALLGAAEPGAAASAAQGDEYLRFSWRVPVAYRATVENNLEFVGDVVAEEDGKGVPWVVVFVGLALLGHLADAVMELQREMRYGGIVIDTRGAKIEITNDKRLDGGLIVIVGDDGTQLYERGQFEDASDLIGAVKK